MEAGRNVAKKKTVKEQATAREPSGDYFEHDEDLARFLTLLLKEVNPSINEAATYELVLQMLGEGTDDDVAFFYGQLIRATVGYMSQDTH
jgi:hypothetical protein